MTASDRESFDEVWDKFLAIFDDPAKVERLQYLVRLEKAARLDERRKIVADLRAWASEWMEKSEGEMALKRAADRIEAKGEGG